MPKNMEGKKKIQARINSSSSFLKNLSLKIIIVSTTTGYHDSLKNKQIILQQKKCENNNETEIFFNKGEIVQK